MLDGAAGRSRDHTTVNTIPPAKCRRPSLMSFCALARDVAKSRMTCCRGTEAPPRNHAMAVRAPVSDPHPAH